MNLIFTLYHDEKQDLGFNYSSNLAGYKLLKDQFTYLSFFALRAMALYLIFQNYITSVTNRLTQVLGHGRKLISIVDKIIIEDNEAEDGILQSQSSALLRNTKDRKSVDTGARKTVQPKDSLDDSLASKSPRGSREEFGFLNVHSSRAMIKRRKSEESPKSPNLQPAPLDNIITQKNARLTVGNADQLENNNQRDSSSFKDNLDSSQQEETKLPLPTTVKSQFYRISRGVGGGQNTLNQRISEESEENQSNEVQAGRQNGLRWPSAQNNNSFQNNQKRSLSTESFGGGNLRSRIQPKQCGKALGGEIGGGEHQLVQRASQRNHGQPATLNNQPVLGRVQQIGTTQEIREGNMQATSSSGNANQVRQVKKLRKGSKVIVEALQAKVRKLQQQLINNKIFLNMVIHDMRNPTNSIEFALKEVLRIITDQSGSGDQTNFGVGNVLKSHSENFRLVTVTSFDSQKEDPHSKYQYDQKRQFSFFGGGGTQKQPEPYDPFFGIPKPILQHEQQFYQDSEKISINQYNGLPLVGSGPAQLNACSAKFPGSGGSSSLKPVLHKDSIFDTPIPPEESVQEPVVPQMKVQECFDHMISDAISVHNPKRDHQTKKDVIENLADTLGPVSPRNEEQKKLLGETTSLNHRIFLDLPNGIVSEKGSSDQNTNKAEQRALIPEQKHNEIRSWINILASSMGHYIGYSQPSHIVCASDQVIPEEYVQGDSYHNISQQIQYRLFPMIKEGLLKGQHDQSIVHVQMTPKLRAAPSVTAENFFGARIGTLVGATSQILSDLQQQNQSHSQGDFFINPNLTSTQQKTILMELEAMMHQLQEKGMIITQDKRSELEGLLKNSVFGSTMILNLINDLLDLAKIESSTFKLNWTYFNLFDVISRSTETLDSQLSAKRIMVSHEFKQCDKEYFLHINGDSHRYFQILLNFMSNAVKFTPMNGNIKIQTILKDLQKVKRRQGNNKNLLEISNKAAIARSDLKVSQNSNNNPNIDRSQLCYIDFEIRIKDSGVGISKENLAKLFMNFSRLEEHQKMNQGGTGLGLSICKSLIELMGGSVSVESELGQGTTFIVSLKTKCKISIRSQQQDSSQEVVKFASSNPNMVNRIAGCQSLTPKMASQELKISSPTAHQAAQTHGISGVSATSKTPQISPEKLANRHNNFNNEMIRKGFPKNNMSFDGYKILEESKTNQGPLTSLMRQMNTFKVPNKTPINHKESGTSLSGLNGFSAQVLNAALEGYKSVSRDPRSPSPYVGRQFQAAFNSLQLDNPTANHFLRQRKLYRILVANDDCFQLRIIQQTLSTFNIFLVDEAENGLVAVDKSRATAYDAVILDLDMPIMCGYEACQKIREGGMAGGGGIKELLHIDQQLMRGGGGQDNIENSFSIYNAQNNKSHQPYIIALSALVTEQVHTKCMEFGFDDVIQSPLSVNVIQQRILAILEQRLVRRKTLQEFSESGGENNNNNHHYHQEEEDYCGDDLQEQEYQSMTINSPSPQNKRIKRFNMN